MRNATIYTYHNVIDYSTTDYKKLVGLDVNIFREHMDFLYKNCNVISMKDLYEALIGKKEIKDDSVVITFDDGYKNQYDNAYPILMEYGFTATFYVGNPSRNNSVFDVNKLHYILASVDSKKLYLEVITRLSEHLSIEEIDELKKSYLVKGKFDEEEVYFVKRTLQKGVDRAIRNEIVDELFVKYVKMSESELAKEIYMSKDMLLELHRNNMEVSPHSASHEWLTTLNEEDQKEEIDSNVSYLNSLGIDTNNFSFCYPYGGYNEVTLSLLSSFDCCLAVTTETDSIILSRDKNRLFELPRVDCNDLTRTIKQFTK